MNSTHLFRTAFAIIIFGIAPPLHAQEPMKLDLYRAVGLALQQNRVLASERASADVAHARVKQYQGMLMPRVSASSSAARSNSPMNTFSYKLLQQHLQPSDLSTFTLNNPSYVTNYQTKLTVEAPIYEGGALWAGKDRAEQMADAADSGVRANTQQLIFQVVRAYAQVFEADTQKSAAKSALDAARHHLKTTRIMAQKGTAIKSDVMDAEVSALNAKIRLHRIENRREKAMDQLRRLLGLGVSSPLRLTRSPSIPAVSDSPKKLVTQAQARRPDLIALQKRLEASRASISEARADFMPHVGVMATQEWNNNTLAPKNPNTTIAGKVTFNLFAGGSDKAAWDAAQAQHVRLQYQLEDKKQEIHDEIMDAWRSMQEAASRAAEQQQALDQARESLRIHALRYRHGLERVTDLLSAQARMDHARASAIHARFDTIISTAHLMLAAGTLTPEAVHE